MKTCKIHLFYLIIFIGCSLCASLHAQMKLNQSDNKKQSSPQSYLLPKDHFLQKRLRNILTDSNMFQSPQHFQNAGFDVILGHKNLMVGFHSSIPSYLIKKFTNEKPQFSQLGNYLKRLKGADTLRDYIKKHNFKHIVVPKKWLYKLPTHFSKDGKASYLLIVENMDIYDDWNEPESEAKKLYYNMDKEVLTELCTILHDVGGCDAYPWNQPFTRSGKIAFVDTEHVGLQKFHDYFIRHIVPQLNAEMQAYALALWAKLEEENPIIKSNKKINSVSER